VLDDGVLLKCELPDLRLAVPYLQDTLRVADYSSKWIRKRCVVRTKPLSGGRCGGRAWAPNQPHWRRLE
jgi:hypothetical protein